jgi:hypothetical protein
MVISRRGEAGGAGALSLTVLNRQPTIQRWLTPVTRLGIPVAGVIAVNATPGLRPVGTCPYCRPEVGVVPGVTGSPAGGDGAHQVRRWLPWWRWTLLVMLTHALLVVLAAGEHAAGAPPAGLIPLTCNELQRLLLRRVLDPARRSADPEAWSRWRRRPQYRARASHYRHQPAASS